MRSPPGFALGVIGGVIILFEMLLWPRKSLFRGWRLGRTKVWMTAHIWLGLLTHPPAALARWVPLQSAQLDARRSSHVAAGPGRRQRASSGSRFQNILPRLMLDQVPAETIYAQIGHVLSQYRDEAGRLVEITCGRAPAAMEGTDGEAVVGELPQRHLPIRPWGRCDRSDGLRERWSTRTSRPACVPGSDALFAFYRDQIEPYLRAARGGDCFWVRRARRWRCSRPSRPACLRTPIRWWTVWPISAINAGSSISRRGCISGFTRGSAFTSRCLWH